MSVAHDTTTTNSQTTSENEGIDAGTEPVKTSVINLQSNESEGSADGQTMLDERLN